MTWRRSAQKKIYFLESGSHTFFRKEKLRSSKRHVSSIVTAWNPQVTPWTAHAPRTHFFKRCVERKGAHQAGTCACRYEHHATSTQKVYASFAKGCYLSNGMYRDTEINNGIWLERFIMAYCFESFSLFCYPDFPNKVSQHRPIHAYESINSDTADEPSDRSSS